MVEYKERLMQAMAMAKRTTKDLQFHLGVTYQAMKSLEDGKTKALSVENNARAARYLEVDAFWLATGEGQPRPPQGWPFESFLPSQYFALDKALREEVEDRLLGAILRQDRANGTQG